jgi:perosamine synthetase
MGRYIESFENSFAAFCGTKYAVAVSNGTTALHLALASHGIGKGDEVIIPDLTFIATANAVTYTGANVVCVDINAETLCIDVNSVERAITVRTKAIIPVHLYGHPAQMDALLALAKNRGILVIEDAAEAHGAEYRGQRVGSFGDCGVFSFYGNKVITTGEGGMLTTNSQDLCLRARWLRDHAMSPDKRYWHSEVGFNYRMTNLQAALGLAQMEQISGFLTKRRMIMDWYRESIGADDNLRLNYEAPDAKNVYWMVCLEMRGVTEPQRMLLMKKLREVGVDSRPYFYPVSDMPMYGRSDTPVAHAISPRGINLPSYTDLTRADVAQIADATRGVLKASKII